MQISANSVELKQSLWLTSLRGGTIEFALCAVEGKTEEEIIAAESKRNKKLPPAGEKKYHRHKKTYFTVNITQWKTAKMCVLQAAMISSSVFPSTAQSANSIVPPRSGPKPSG
jgi:hypothetical protein